METPEQLVRNAELRLYWDRNAPLTFAVLVCVIAVSAFLRPIGWISLIGTVVTGSLFYLALQLIERGRGYLGGLAFVFGAVVAAATGVLRGPFMLIQGIGGIGATIAGCMVFAKALRKGQG